MKNTNFLRDYSIWTLLVANVISGVLIANSKSSITNLLWVFWFQSAIIGVINFLDMLTVKNYEKETIIVNDVPTVMNGRLKVSMALLFLFCYGGFQFGYFLFLLQFNPHPVMKELPEFSIIIPSAISLVLSHIFSYIYNYKQERSRTKSVSRMLFSPIGRIWLMAIIIFMGAYFQEIGISILAFLILKLFADLWSHAFIHRHNNYARILSTA